MLILAYHLLSKEDIRIKILDLLLLVVNKDWQKTLNPFHQVKLRRKLSVGISKSLIANMNFMRTETDWKTVHSLIEWSFSDSNTFKDGFEILYYIVFALPIEAFKMDKRVTDISSFIQPINFNLFIGLLEQIVLNPTYNQSNRPNMTDYFILKSLECLQYILNTIPTFYGISIDDPSSLAKEDEVVQNYLIPTLKIVCRVCLDSRISVHNNAIACLQRALSLELYSLSSNNSLQILEQVIFDLLTKLRSLNPVKGGLSKDSIENIRLRAISILCKTFLQFTPKLIVLPTFKILWEEILQFIADYINADSELLAEAVPLTLKNMLIVMHSNGILIPTDDPSTEDDLWKISWKKIDSFYPKLKEEFTLVTAKSPSSETIITNPSQ